MIFAEKHYLYLKVKKVFRTKNWLLIKIFLKVFY